MVGQDYRGWMMSDLRLSSSYEAGGMFYHVLSDEILNLKKKPRCFTRVRLHLKSELLQSCLFDINLTPYEYLENTKYI